MDRFLLMTNFYSIKLIQIYRKSCPSGSVIADDLIVCLPGVKEVRCPLRIRVATKILRRFWGRAADTGSMIL